MLSAEVITTAGDEQKLAKARELGADHTIDHYKQKISDEVKRITNRRGVDIVFEHVGQATWKESLKSLKPRRHAGDLRRHHRFSGRPRSAVPVLAAALATGVVHGRHG